MPLKIQAEVAIDSEPCVLAWNNKLLFVGTENGTIKAFNPDLSTVSSWSAHEAQVFALAAGDAVVYSVSYDAGIRVWNEEGKKLSEIPKTGGDIGVMRIFGKHLYTGDEIGNVTVYENNTEVARYNLLEEVKDLTFSQPYLFTVRDLDVTVTEINPGISKNKYTMRHSFEGRAPLQVTGTRILVMARGGNILKLHDASIETQFKKLHEIKVSDMIITSLSVNGDFVWTAGWDGQVQCWKITVENQLEPVGQIKLGACVNAVIASNPDKAYAISSGGKIFLLQLI